MLERITQSADISIRRGCGFALFGIACLVAGLSFDPVMAAKSGAITLSLLVAVLIYKATQAPVHNYRHTEVWIMLDKKHGLPEHRAQDIIGRVLKERYIWHAQASAAMAALLWVVSFAAWMIRT